jgi:cell shape-determining protein MreD
MNQFDMGIVSWLVVVAALIVVVVNLGLIEPAPASLKSTGEDTREFRSKNKIIFITFLTIYKPFKTKMFCRIVLTLCFDVVMVEASNTDNPC